MRKTKIYDIAARVLIAALVLMMATVAARYLVKQFFVEGTDAHSHWVDMLYFDAPALLENGTDTQETEQSAASAPNVDWAALYPPQAEGNGEEAEKLSGAAAALAAGAQKLQNFIAVTEAKTASYTARVNDLEELITAYTTDYAVGYQKMVELANRYDEMLAWQIAGVESYNPVIMLEDNYFVTCVARQDRTERAAAIADLRDFCRENGMAHLYVTTPNDTCRFDEGVSGVADFYNYNADRLQALLKDANVQTMDLRDNLHAAGMDHHKSFYQTDHHWLPQTGLWAAGEIAEKLNSDYGFAIDTSVYDADQYDYELYPEWFLGSQGKKVTLSRAKPEDFYLIYPKFDTTLHIEIPSISVDKTGDFSVVYCYGYVQEKDYYNQSPYAAYLYGDNALTHLHNEQLSDGKHALVLGHSFDNCVIPFLSLGIEYVDSMDLRMFTGDLKTYLSKNHYDVVIELYTE